MLYGAPKRRAMIKAVHRTQKNMTTVKTRGIVTNALYLKWSFIARSLSTEMADMTKKETPAHTQAKDPVVVILAMQKPSEFLLISKIICRAYIGWTMALTSKSESARLQRSVFDGVRSERVLFTAIITRILPAVDVTEVSKFTTMRITLVIKVSLVWLHSSSRW